MAEAVAETPDAGAAKPAPDPSGHSDASMARLAALPPDAESVRLSTLVDPARLSAAARIDLLVALEKQAAWVAARQLELLAAIDAADPSPDRWASDEVAAALRIAPATAGGRMELARRLAGALRQTRQALFEGRITSRHVTVLADGVRHLDDKTAAVIQDRVLPSAPDVSVAEFGRRVRRAVLRHDPAGEEERHCVAAEQRRVVITPDNDGMAQLWALLPAVGAATIRTAIDALAAETVHGTRGDSRTADQRRADALVTMADAVLSDPKLARQHGHAPGIQLTVAASTLLGHDDQPGELAGHGPITAAAARALAGTDSAAWRLLLTDQAGRLVDISRTAYRPPQAMRDLIVCRDRRCTFPGCSQPAARCDLDHLVPHAAGGTTAPANLHPLCRRHHRGKHTANWTPHRATDGSTTWTSPTGHTYRTEPAPLPIDHVDDG